MFKKVMKYVMVFLGFIIIIIYAYAAFVDTDHMFWIKQLLTLFMVILFLNWMGDKIINVTKKLYNFLKKRG